MKTPLAEKSRDFLNFLDQWQAGLETISLKEALPRPENGAVLSVDVIDGFCFTGPLASPRVAGIVEPITRLFKNAWEHGVRHFILTQDTHEPNAVEFAAWPPHCIRGTAESQTVEAFKALPFFEQMVLFEKNSISSGLHTGLDEWLSEHPQVDTFVVVGDCTDLCTYQLAMHLRLDANARQLQRRVIVPANTAETYDRSVETARQQGGLPHDGDLLHAIFLYHMALNGIEVVRAIE